MDRSQYIGGSDAKRIIEGDWLTLYEEKLGIRQPEDLSREFCVQLGIYTEGMHAMWIDARDGLALDPLPHQARLDHPFIGGRPDRWSYGLDTFVELKHSNPWSAREAAEFYQPQMAHYCAVTGRSWGLLSVIPGNQEPFSVRVEPDPEYIAKLIELEVAFWWYVENREAPMYGTAAFPDVEKAAAKMKVNGMRKVDMTGNNQWADLARTIIETDDAATRYEKAKADIKKLVEADVAEAHGHGISFKRDTRGALRMTVKEKA